MGVGCLWNCFGLAGPDEDYGCNQDDRYSDDEANNDGLDGRVACAFFRGGVASCWPLFAHAWLDAEAAM
jgi:hypothetical protein